MTLVHLCVNNISLRMFHYRSFSDLISMAASGNQLDLGGGGFLAISDNDMLVYHEPEHNVTSGAMTGMCGAGKRAKFTKSVPLYNILYVSAEDNYSIIVDYAHQTSSTRLSTTRLTIPCTNVSAQDFVSCLLSRAYGKAKVKKRAFILINPHAGPGGADRLWEREVKPIFEAARMSLTVVHTTYSGEAIKLIQDMDLNAFDAIIPCSGDGLPHEVFNGLAKRGDARRALSTMPVAHIPCGSGNAMSCNLYGTHRPSLAALAIVKGIITPLDLVSITQGDRRTLSFLSQALGIIAESDLATEHLRWMGEQRFTYGIIQRMFRKKVYPCDLAVKVAVQGKRAIKEHYDQERSEIINKVSTVNSEDRNERMTPQIPCENSPRTGPINCDDLPPLEYGTVNDELPLDWELIKHEKLGTFYCGNVGYSNLFSLPCSGLFYDLILDIFLLKYTLIL